MYLKLIMDRVRSELRPIQGAVLIFKDAWTKRDWLRFDLVGVGC